MPGAHSQEKTRGPGRRLLTFVLPVAVLVMVVGGVAGVVLLRGSTGRAAASPTSNPDAATDAAFFVQSVTPTAGTTQVPSDAPIEVRFTDPLSAKSPTPSLTPPSPVRGRRSPRPPSPSWPRPARALLVGDRHGARGSRWRGELDRQAHPRHGDRPVQRGSRKRAAPPAASGTARLPATGLHPGEAAHLGCRGGRPAAGRIHLARQRAGVAQLSMDRRLNERHHYRRHHGLRVGPKSHHRRRSRPTGLDASAGRRHRWDGQHGAVRLRLRVQGITGNGHRLQQRCGRLLDVGQHRRRGGAQPSRALSPSTSASR